MPIINTVNKSKLGGALRIEAEFYTPEHLAIEAKLLSLGAQPFSRYCTFIKKGIFDLPPSQYSSVGIPLIRTTEIKSTIADLTDAVRIPEAIHRKNFKTELTSGDIVFTKIGANIGDSAILPEAEPLYNFSQNVAGAKIRHDIVNSKWLASFFSTRYGRSQLKRIQMLSGQGKLELVDIKQILIPPASPFFQNQISALYSDAESRLASSYSLYLQANAQLLSAIGLDSWSPDHTLTFIANSSSVVRFSRIDAEYFQPKFGQMIIKVPDSIQLTHLGKLTSLTKGIEVGSSAYIDEGAPFWRVSNLTKFGLDTSTLHRIHNELCESLRSYQPQQGELLLTKDATPGVAFYLHEPVEGIVSSGILRLSLTDTIPPSYLELVLNSMFVQMQIEQDSGGSVIKHWKPSSVRKTLIPRLPNSIENSISELVQQSHSHRKRANVLIEKAVKSVELSIEEGEQSAMAFLRRNQN